MGSILPQEFKNLRPVGRKVFHRVIFCNISENFHKHKTDSMDFSDPQPNTNTKKQQQKPEVISLEVGQKLVFREVVKTTICGGGSLPVKVNSSQAIVSRNEISAKMSIVGRSIRSGSFRKLDFKKNMLRPMLKVAFLHIQDKRQ